MIEPDGCPKRKLYLVKACTEQNRRYPTVRQLTLSAQGSNLSDTRSSANFSRKTLGFRFSKTVAAKITAAAGGALDGYELKRRRSVKRMRLVGVKHHF